MKPKTNRIILAIAFLAVFAAGTYCGYVFSFWTSANRAGVDSLRKDQFQGRLEGYQPSCEDLTSKTPIIHSKENDYIAVLATDTYFYVFGFNAEAGRPPLISWWGAGIDEARRQECGGK
jgi:hypothetical protein